MDKNLESALDQLKSIVNGYSGDCYFTDKQAEAIIKAIESNNEFSGFVCLDDYGLPSYRSVANDTNQSICRWTCYAEGKPKCVPFTMKIKEL